jgi:hypothetical protein
VLPQPIRVLFPVSHKKTEERSTFKKEKKKRESLSVSTLSSEIMTKPLFQTVLVHFSHFFLFGAKDIKLLFVRNVNRVNEGQFGSVFVNFMDGQENFGIFL